MAFCISVFEGLTDNVVSPSLFFLLLFLLTGSAQIVS